MNRLIQVQGWHLRLTLESDLDTVSRNIDNLCNQYIISQELSNAGKMHYHCFLVCDKSRDFMRKFITEKFEVKGNKDYSLAPVKSARQMKKYVLKDGNYRYKGYDWQEIKVLEKSSSKKIDEEYKNRLGEIEDEYLKYGGSMTDEEFCVRVLMLRSEYMTVRRCDIEGYVNRMYIRKRGIDGAKKLARLWFAFLNREYYG